MPRPIKPPPLPDEDWLSIEQIQSLFGYTRGSLYVQRSRNTPPGSLGVLWQSRLWWRASDIDRYLHEQLVDNPDARWSQRHTRKGEQIKTFARSEFDRKKKEAAKDVR